LRAGAYPAANCASRLGMKVAAGRVAVTKDGGVEGVTSTRAVVYPTGSEATPLAAVPVDEQLIVSSSGVLSLPEILSGWSWSETGYVGLELGSVWLRLGSELAVVDPRIASSPGASAIGTLNASPIWRWR